VLIEFAWGKRIMETYLNVVKWGRGLYGAEAAAQYHFHKPAAALTADEAVRLAAVLPDPLDWSTAPPRPATPRPRHFDPCKYACGPHGVAPALRALEERKRAPASSKP
jgi:hypothetical protein